MLTVGQVAKAAGVSTQTVRFYERECVLPKACRSSAGYRQFPEDAVRIIRFVRHAQVLGFSLDDIRELLRLRSSRRSSCQRVQRLAQGKHDLIEEKIAQLEAMKSALDELLGACRSRDDPLVCPILESLEEEQSSQEDRL